MGSLKDLSCVYLAKTPGPRRASLFFDVHKQSVSSEALDTKG